MTVRTQLSVAPIDPEYINGLIAHLLVRDQLKPICQQAADHQKHLSGGTSGAWLRIALCFRGDIEPI
jgi:hypothetical protein